MIPDPAVCPWLRNAVRDAARRAGKGLPSWLAEAAATKLRAEALEQHLDEWEHGCGRRSGTAWSFAATRSS